MSFTYDNTLSGDRDKVRFYLQDTVDAGHYFEDEELDFLLSDNTSVIKTVADAALILFNQFAQALSVAEVDDVRIETKDRMKYYEKVYNEFKKKSDRSTSVLPIIIGGDDRLEFIERSAGRTLENRTDDQIRNFFDDDIV